MEITVKWLKERWFKKIAVNSYYYRKEIDMWDYIRHITFNDECTYADIYDISKNKKVDWPFWWKFPEILFEKQYIRWISRYQDIETLLKCDRKDLLDYILWF